MKGPAALAFVLVVDPVSERHPAYGDLLRDLVHEVVAVTSDADVRRLAEETSFAAVVVHLDRDGELSDAAAGSAVLEHLPGLPVIFISAHMPNFSKLGGELRGPFDYLPSPIVPGLLRSKVSTFVELARMREALSHSAESVLALERQVGLAASAADKERRTAESLQGLLGEQIHRSKNLLAIIQSVALRTINEGRNIAEARDALAGRLRLLSRVYQLQTAAHGGLEMGELVEAALGDIVDRVTVNGPPLRLTGSIVQTFALAIHELATNAEKHGALCAQGGAVSVGWTFFENGDDRYLEFAWSERGGPPVDVPPHHGFGLTLVSSLAGTAPDPSIRFNADGFDCRMRLSQDFVTG